LLASDESSATSGTIEPRRTKSSERSGEFAARLTSAIAARAAPFASPTRSSSTSGAAAFSLFCSSFVAWFEEGRHETAPLSVCVAARRAAFGVEWGHVRMG
jgi:hypothetical protein